MDTEITQVLHSEDDNTITSSPPEKRYRNWLFTLNNYTQEEILYIENWCITQKAQYIFQEEKGKEGTPHLQGTIFLKNGKTFSAFKKDHPRMWFEQIRNKKGAANYCKKEDTRNGKIYTNMKQYTPLKDPMENKTLKSWQKEILTITSNPPDERKIHWYYDTIGGIGKTQFAKHLCMKNKCYLYLNGKAADMKYAIAQSIENNIYPECIMIDLTRTSEAFVSYQGIEEIKNGIFFSGKYKAGMCLFDIPHIIIFSNFPPELHSLSMDRWIVNNLTDITD